MLDNDTSARELTTCRDFNGVIISLDYRYQRFRDRLPWRVCDLGFVNVGSAFSIF